MKKIGPCRHCGIESTPLWRNGPEDKPVLCNACGSRFRLVGTLDAYMPRHFHTGLLKNLEKFKDEANLNQNSNDHANRNVTDNPSTDTLPNSGIGMASFLDTEIPTKKRTEVVYLKINSPMEKFQNEMYNMWRLHGNLDEPEEVLIPDKLTDNIVPSNEIGLGAMLLKPHDADAPNH